MGKYGFNENELRKTVTDMIDKDGFHKEVVTYGKSQPPHIATAMVNAIVSNPLASEYLDVHLLTINVSEDADIYVKGSATDDDWVLEIGDTIETPSNFLHNGRAIEDIGAILVVDSSQAENSTRYYQVYAVDEELKVLDRTKLTVVVAEPS